MYMYVHVCIHGYLYGLYCGNTGHHSHLHVYIQYVYNTSSCTYIFMYAIQSCDVSGCQTPNERVKAVHYCSGTEYRCYNHRSHCTLFVE